MDKKLRGLSLMDYKEIEREATATLITGKKIVLSSELMLKCAETKIMQLGGKTLKEEDKEAEEGRKATSETRLQVR